MTADREIIRLSLGGYVLGTLSPAEAEHIRAHLAECARCRAEYAELAGLPALLATITEAEAAGRAAPEPSEDLADRLVQRAAESGQPSPQPPSRPTVPAAVRVPQEGLLDRLLQQAAARRRTAWRRQLAGAAATLTLMAAAAGGTWLAASGSVGSQAARPGPTSPAPVRTFSGRDPTTGVSVSVKVSPAAWGSVLQVSAKGAPAGITCTLQVVGLDGVKAVGASWRAGEYPGGTTIPGAVPMPPGAIGHFDIFAGNGQKLITIPA